MKNKVSLPKHDFEMLVMTSARYALGRQSYIVGWTNDVIRAHVHTLRVSTLCTISNDISLTENLGMEQDKKNWVQTSDIIKNEIIEREKTNDNTQSTNITRRKKKAVSVH